LIRASGDIGGSLASIRAAIAETDRLGSARLLLPAVELALEAGETGTARGLARQLRDTASGYGTPGLAARADQAEALLELAAGRPAEALTRLERAAAVYRTQRFRYATAKVHELMAAAH